MPSLQHASSCALAAACLLAVHALPEAPRPADGAGASSFCGASGWKQVWADEFNTPTLDNSSWTLDLKAGDSRVRDSQGTADNVYLEDGALVLRSQRQTAGKYNFTSGGVQTQGKHAWKGPTRACVRAKLPGGGGGSKGDGIWPAHWMMPDNKACWPSNGEIDIMEMINGDGVTHGTYHWQLDGHCGDKPNKHPSSGSSKPVGTGWATDFHEYAVEYDEEHISFALDGVVFETITTATQGKHALFFDVPYYMILNTAVGGPWPKPVGAGTTFPTYHRIDYVRIAQQHTEG